MQVSGAVAARARPRDDARGRARHGAGATGHFSCNSGDCASDKLLCACVRRSVALGQRAPNRATAREDGRGMGAGMKGGTGAKLLPRASPPHASCALHTP